MNVKLTIKNNLVHNEKLFGKSEVVGYVHSDGTVVLNEDFYQYLKSNKASVTTSYTVFTPQHEFRRKF